MADQRNGGIAWTEQTWNPIRGCSRVSEGCRHCYAERVAGRFSGPGKPYEGLITIGEKGPRWNGKVRLVYDQLHKPIHWRRHRRIFVNSMSDLFHEGLSDEDRDKVFAVMLACEVLAPRKDFAPGLGHVFQALTKRPEVMRRYLSADPVELVKRWAKAGDYNIHVDDGNVMFSELVESAASHRTGEDGVRIIETKQWGFVDQIFPLRNAWLGVSVEDQASADARIPLLLETPAVVRWVSYEPAIGPVDFGLSSATCTCCDRWSSRWVRLHRPVVSEMPFGPLTSAAPGVYRASSNRHGALSVQALDGKPIGIKPAEFDALPRLDWVVIGGESGPGARPFDLVWARSVIAQAKDTGCKVFVKQLGSSAVDGWLSTRAMQQRVLRLQDRKGGDPSEWPEDLRVREWPEVPRG